MTDPVGIMSRVPQYARTTILVVALVWLSLMVGPNVPDGLCLLLPIFYLEVFFLARWLFFRFRWRKVRVAAEVDDLDKEWELYNQ